jgi:hypothetical protein
MSLDKAIAHGKEYRKAKSENMYFYLGHDYTLFKRMNRQIERAQQNQALREGRDLPIIKKNDLWNYT